tara:strand:+ start:11342 stop:11857 length:516 start_codon:yes stop_codon:yes gene_type:complete
MVESEDARKRKASPQRNSAQRRGQGTTAMRRRRRKRTLVAVAVAGAVVCCRRAPAPKTSCHLCTGSAARGWPSRAGGREHALHWRAWQALSARGADVMCTTVSHHVPRCIPSLAARRAVENAGSRGPLRRCGVRLAAVGELKIPETPLRAALGCPRTPHERQHEHARRPEA